MPRMPPKSTHLMIRLGLYGCANRPFYHIGVVENRANRNYPPLEQLGSYDPMPNTHQEKLVAINFDRLRYWIASGAKCSKPVEQLLGLAGFFPLHPMSIIEARRNREKAKKQEQEAAEAAEEKTKVKTES